MYFFFFSPMLCDENSDQVPSCQAGCDVANRNKEVNRRKKDMRVARMVVS